MIKRNMVTAPEREAIDQRLKDIQYEWYIEGNEQKPPTIKATDSDAEKARQLNEKLDRQIREQLK